MGERIKLMGGKQRMTRAGMGRPEDGMGMGWDGMGGDGWMDDVSAEELVDATEDSRNCRMLLKQDNWTMESDCYGRDVSASASPPSQGASCRLGGKPQSVSH